MSRSVCERMMFGTCEKSERCIVSLKDVTEFSVGTMSVGFGLELKCAWCGLTIARRYFALVGVKNLGFSVFSIF